MRDPYRDTHILAGRHYIGLMRCGAAGNHLRFVIEPTGGTCPECRRQPVHWGDALHDPRNPRREIPFTYDLMHVTCETCKALLTEHALQRARPTA